MTQSTETVLAPGTGLQVDPSAYAIGTDCSHEEFLAITRVYARAVVNEHGLAVTVSDIEWSVSTRAKRRAGALRYTDGTPEEIVLTWGQFQSNGWEATAATVRHELVHAHLLVEAGDASHGPRFRRLADRLDTHVHCERFADPEWWVTCRDCGTRLARYRRSKLVEHPDQYRCGECGGTLAATRNE